MIYFTTEEIDRLISEDVPYIDLTSHLLGISSKRARICFFTREDAVTCGTEEVIQIFERLGIQVDSFLPSGSQIPAGSEIISGIGEAEKLHYIWKVSQNILDHCAGIATKTRQLVDTVRSVNKDISILTTRKGFPGTKKLAIKSILAGGAVPHRLGLSETILIFKQHMDMIGGFDALLERLPAIKAGCCEKKIIVETIDGGQALELCRRGADGIQFDKLSPGSIKEIAVSIKEQYPEKILLAAGGIHLENASLYAQAPIDGIVTSSLYNARPINIGVKMVPVK